MIDIEGQLKRIDIDGIIYFDSVLGIAGTTYPIGTRELPSNTIADVITLCALHNVRHINVRGVLTLGAAMSAYRFDGYKHLDIAHSVNLNGQDVSVSSFHRLIITGAQAGAGLASYDDCMLLNVTGFNGVATLCGLITSLTLNAATASGFINCFSYLGTCTINLGTPTVANFVNLAGSFILANQTAGVTNIWAANGCEITIAASCTGGIINIYGNAQVTGAGGGVTINNYSLEATIDRQLFVMDFWSTPQEEVAVTNAAGDKALPDVTVADLPAGATIVRAIVMFKFRMVENTNGAANNLNGAQEIQVRDDSPSAWIDAINFVDNQFSLAATTREGGDVIIGAINVAATVDGNDTYNFQWDEAIADLANIQFNDVQVGLRIWYSI